MLTRILLTHQAALHPAEVTLQQLHTRTGTGKSRALESSVRLQGLTPFPHTVELSANRSAVPVQGVAGVAGYGTVRCSRRHPPGRRRESGKFTG